MGGNGSEHLQELSLVTKVSFKVGYISLKGMRNRTQRKSCADFQPGPHCLFGTVVLETLPCWEKTVSHIGALVHKPSWGPQPKTALTVAMWVRHLEHPAGLSLHVTPLPAAEERPRATRTQLGLTNLQKHKRPVPSPGCLPQTVPWAVGLETTGIHSLTILAAGRLKSTCQQDYTCADSVVPDSGWPQWPQPARPLWPCDSPGKNTGAGCHFLLQGLFPTQGSNLISSTGRWVLHH